MKPRTPSVDAWLSAGLFAAGSLVFLTGGRQHPQINAQTMPTAGSLEYFRHFAAMVLETPGWETFHSMILAGPLLWAMGAAVGWRLFAKRAAPVADLGKHALLAGAVLWALAFVLDGYVAPRYARAILEAGPDADAAAIATFGANAFTMARLGTISLALMASGIVALSVSLLLTVRAGWRSLVGYAGLLVGAWPLLATVLGEFYPGPFTSTRWMMTALSLGVWFLALAIVLPLANGSRGVSPEPGDGSEAKLEPSALRGN